jgi:hypothetical protein
LKNHRQLLVLLFLLPVLGLAAWIAQSCKSEPEIQPEQKTTVRAATRVSRTKAGDPQLTLDAAAQTLAGLQTQVLQSRLLQPEVVAYGRLEEDPARSFVLRAPATGVLLASPGGDWPRVGGKIEGGRAIGQVVPRFTPSDRIALNGQLANARSEVSASTAEVTAARSAYERLRTLNADKKNVSDRAVDEALARLQGGEAKLKAATETVKLIESSLQSAGPAEEKPLVLPHEGDVVEVMAQPGETIESGAPILRVTRLDHLLARVEIPIGQAVSPGISTARIAPLGQEDQPIAAERIATSTTIDPKSQGQSFLFRLGETRSGMRPGLAITAYLATAGASRKGVVVPRSAIIRHEGKTFAYVQVSSDQFVRKEMPVTEPVAGGYFTVLGFAPGDRIVIVGAQLLLSEEFKAQTQIEREGT